MKREQARRRRRSARPVDVAGIGAINLDYVGQTPELELFFRQKIEEDRERLTWGGQTTASRDEINEALALFQRRPTPTVGGSALNALRVVARLGLDLRTGFVGVLGAARDGVDPFEELNDLEMELCLARSSEPCGVCVSFVGSEHGRTMLTWHGANEQLMPLLSADARWRERAVSLLARAPIVHVTAILHEEGLAIIGSVLADVLEKNPSACVCVDPGLNWARETPERLSAVLRHAHLVFVNRFELASLAGMRVADASAEQLACEALERQQLDGSLLVKGDGGETTIYRRSRVGLEIASVAPRMRRPTSVASRDDTGAGDVFAAGVLAALASPRIRLDDGLRLGAALAQIRLRSSPTAAEAEYAATTLRYAGAPQESP